MILIINICLFYVIYICWHWPYEDNKTNYITVFYECCTMLAYYAYSMFLVYPDYN